MCHFHSVIVTGDGRILHLPENSHSSIAAHYELESGLDAKWWECEWDGRGSMPVNIIDDRGKGEPTQAAERAATRHYEKLALIMSGAAKPEDVEPFNQPEYSDVRLAVVENAERLKREAEAAEAARVKAEREAAAEAEATAAFTAVDDQLSTLDNDILIRVIWKIIAENHIDMEDVAADEIQAVKEAAEDWDSDHPAYQAGLEAGYESASEDLYSSDYVHENIKDFINDVEDLFEDEFQAAREESYAIGYRDCKQGKPSAHAEYFVDGMPSFLF